MPAQSSSEAVNLRRKETVPAVIGIMSADQYF